MARSFSMSERYPSPAPGRLPEQRSKATGGGSSPLDPMGSNQPGYCAPQGQNPGDCPTKDCDKTPLAKRGAKK
jgi:hypothetical protein